MWQEGLARSSVFCPYDGSDTRVTNSRPSKKYPEVWRRRRCKVCKNIWTTREYIDLYTSHRVLTRHKKLQAFSRDKLLLSIIEALKHRQDALDEAIELTETIIRNLLKTGEASIPAYAITAETILVLKRFDPTAASVYESLHVSSQ